MNSLKDEIQKLHSFLVAFLGILIVFSGLLVIAVNNPDFLSSGEAYTEVAADLEYEEFDDDTVVDGTHLRTGLKDAPGLMTVVHNCTNCHSAQLVIQNRMDRKGWEKTIDWMQQTQNLWDLGKNEQIIIDYLVTNYPITKKGRRQNLQDIEWYDLK